MHLSVIEVSNYKPFAHAVLQMPERGVACIVGPNNSGKSAILGALETPFAQPSEVRRYGATECARVIVTFNLDDEDRIRIAEGFGTNPTWMLGTAALGTTRLTFTDARDTALRLERVEISNATGHLDLVGEISWGVPGGDIMRVARVARFLQQESVEPWTTAGETSGSFQDALQESKDLSPVLNLIRDRWRGRLFRFDTHRPGTTNRRSLGTATSVTPNGENLPEFLVYLKTNDDERFGLIGDALEDIIPDLGRLTARTEGSQTWVEFLGRTGMRRNLTELGTGVSQVLLAACVGESAHERSVILLEEPELHLHPGAQRKLYEHLDRWSRRALIVATTHSTVLVDEASRTGELWSVERSDEISRVSRASTEIPDVLVRLGVRPADVLSAEGVLIVEGPSDAAILRVWMKNLFQRRGVALITAGGGDAAWQTDTLVRWFEQADTLTRAVAVVRDRDELRQDQIRRLEETGHVVVLERRELENYLLEPSAIAAVLEELTGESVDLREIRSDLSAACDGLYNNVLIKTFAANLPIQRLLDRRAVAELVSHGAANKEAVLAHIRSSLAQAIDTSELTRLWERLDSELSESWNDSRLDLVAGSDVLEVVWRTHGRKYSKERHGVALARLVEAPEAIVIRVGSLLGEK